MVTWEHNIKYYTATLDLLDDYGNTKLKGIVAESVLQTFNLLLMEKIHVNLLNSVDLLKKVADQPMNFLSYGLILRGMVSDLINYKFLRQVYDVAGRDVFENEVKILDLDFVNAYRAFVESEKKLAGSDAEMEKAMEAKFKDTFKEFYKGDTLIKEKDLRTEPMMKPLRDFIATNGLDNTMNLGSEAGKLKFIFDKNIEQLKITYKYLSQLQHFSSRAYNFYKTKEYQDFNPYFSLLVVFITIKVLVSIANDLAPDKPTTEKYVALATEISKLTE